MTIRSIAATTAFAALSLVAGTTFCAGVASAEEVTAAAKPAAVAADEKVCAKVQLTGSRIAHNVCQTRGEWIAQQGVDPITLR
ncbi:hypothetical protein [Sphingomonas sp. Y38-1Y]|uniref:hypothetical protein n=1 Tax=Sphingomonas sp. Y38-1Y TaxID=3078265 RepID=UPI0028E9D39A|nr:hypothetical protein [Sphingomonas sp. Y38-1Y]